MEVVVLFVVLFHIIIFYIENKYITQQQTFLFDYISKGNIAVRGKQKV
jgi:hypothetical protein|tara:strand:- start:671 stop:814 length:144 start_codon:yes stop_codon:yes gene_type:complete